MRDISNVKQEIINYRRIVKPQRPTLRLLERSNQRFAPQDLELYFDDIVDKSERIWDLLENYKEVAEALEATNESVIAHRLNDVIRILTILSASCSCRLTLITSIWGMNVGRPAAAILPRRRDRLLGHPTRRSWSPSSPACSPVFRHKRWL